MIGQLFQRAAVGPLSLIDPETAHGLAIAALKSGVLPRLSGRDDPRLKVKAFGLEFPNPVGMAAGFDKDAEVPSALLKLGFGFAEAGTLTPKPQAGNPRPRVFRLPADRAVINRLGFNNHGYGPAISRLRSDPPAGIVGVNIGANRDSTDRIADYLAGLEAFWGLAAYFVINISSPNTPGLRDLQDADHLSVLLERIMAHRADLVDERGTPTPVLVKIAPDNDDAALQDLADICMAHAVDGLIVSNTTITRPGLGDRRAAETGGLSGRPLYPLSTRTLARMFVATGGKLPLIGVGGIDSAKTAYGKIAAGACLIQLYTGLIYEGPGLIGRIKSGLADRLERDGFPGVAEAVGADADRLAADD